jgi:outer membrane lipoprotein-sorting protein
MKLTLFLAAALSGAAVQDEAAQAILRRLSERMKDARMLSAKVVQSRKTALLEAPIVSSGTLYYRREPGRLVFRMTDPRPTEIHLDARSYQVYRPDEKRLEQIEFESGDAAGRLLMVFQPKPDEVGKAFTARRGETKAGEAAVVLEPSDERIRRRVTKITLWVEEKEATLRRIQTTDADGDEVTFELSELRLNPEIDPAIFELKVPEGTRILKQKANLGQ